MSTKLKASRVAVLLVSLILVSMIRVDLIVHMSPVHGEPAESVFTTRDYQGINVTLANRFELYFNATNGGEITRYYDLSYDPFRTSNLVLPANRSYQQQSSHNLYPLLSSILYNPNVADFKAVGSTGGDGNATLAILGSGTRDGLDYVILQATARTMDSGGGVFEDVHGKPNCVRSTWLIRGDGYIFLERTLYTPNYAVIQGEYRWYPFYLVRTTGFSNIATFYLFNETYAYTYNIQHDTYVNNYTSYPELPRDRAGYFGVAAPFSNTSLGGDGTNNIVLVYDLSGSTSISEWKADCYTNAEEVGGTEFGAVHEFDADYNIATQTYHAMIALTHDAINERNAAAFAEYFSKNTAFPLAKTSLTASRVFYELGEPFVIDVSAAFNYSMTNLSRTLTLTDEFGRTLWREDYGTVNVSQGEIWSSIQLLNQTVSAIITSDRYTFTFSFVSEHGIVVGSDNVDVIVTVQARQFGKMQVGGQNATSYRDYKMISRYLMPEDGWITSILMWFGNQGFEAKVAIYSHPEGTLLVQSQSEAISSTGWHNFTVPRTFLFSGLYGLSWKNSENAITAYDIGSNDQTARTPELYSYSFSPTFGSPEFFGVETSIYAIYDPAVAKVGMSSYPQKPNYDENATVIAYGAEGEILTGPVVLSYSTSANDLDWVNVSMMPDQGVFTAQIPPHRYDTTVYYKVSAQNARGETVSSEMHSYVVGDSRPPSISYLERTPVSPNCNETVTMSATVGEPINASGIKLVVLRYWNGSEWMNVDMTLENELYTATIPGLAFGTMVNYTVQAFDHAQNTAVSDIYSYKVVDTSPPTAPVQARQFGKTEVGLQNATSYRDYKMISRYLMPEDGWVTSILMWFGNQGFEAKVAIYSHPEGTLIVQSQSEAISSAGWHNFTVPRTFLFSGLYGLSWKNSENAITAYDIGFSDQTARTPELYSYSFSSTFGSPTFFPVQTSIYATYYPVVARVGLSSYPQRPSYDENVTVTAYAADGGVLIAPAILSFSVNGRDWVSVSMMPDQGVFTAQIPPHRYDTTVYHKVSAQNARGETISSEMHSYTVADSRPPIISYLETTPVSPNYNETAVVSATVSEPINASRVKLVVLCYWNGSAWTSINMTLANRLYTATIPGLAFGTMVNYTVQAFDHAQNTAVSDVHLYKVTDTFSPTVNIDGLAQTSLKSIVRVNVTGNDVNFDKMDLYISGQLAQTWNKSGSEVYYWDTTKYPDGVCLVKLVAYDKANNIGEKEVAVNIDNVVPGWTLSLIAALGLIVATLIGTWAYSVKWRKERAPPRSIPGSRLENRVAKPILRLAIILQALWYGFWITAEILIWHKPLNVALTTSPINDFGFITAILLLLLFEIWQRRQFTKSEQT